MSTWCERCALQYPALALLASEFLHADWSDEYSDVDDAVHAFALKRPALAARLPDEVDRLLADMLSEDQLEDLLLDHLGLAYRPHNRLTCGAWLKDVSERVHSLVPRP